MHLPRRPVLLAAAAAFVVGGLAGVLLAGSPQDEGRAPLPPAARPPELFARVENGGAVEMVAAVTLKDARGRVVQEHEVRVPAGRQVDVPLAGVPVGEYRVGGAFRNVDRPGATATADRIVEVGGCGPGRPAGVLFRVAGQASGPAIRGIEDTCRWPAGQR